MKALTFLVELHEPLLATQVQSGEANSGVTYPFIPGSMIRGALVAQYTGGKLIADIQQDEIFQCLFLNGSVYYLNAYLTHPDSQLRALPRPLSWLTPKEDADNPEADIFDFARTPPGDKPHKAPASGDFVWQSGGSVALASPDRVGIVHNTSKNPNRKDEESSNVYRYEALAAGQVFAGAVLSEDKTLLEEVRSLLAAGTFNLGGSHTAGYGRVSICSLELDLDWQEFTPASFDDSAEWHDEEEDGEAVAAEAAPEFVILTCLSDLIWRDELGQISGNLNTPSGEKPINAFYCLRPVGGFNRKWGLPLCQALAIQAGSVFVFSPSCYAELEEWVKKGVGERRIEGFGRVALNWHTQPKISQTLSPVFKPAAIDTLLSDESRKLAQEMANRQLQAQVDRALVRRINELSHFQNLPKTVHLARARLAARRAWYKGDLQEITGHFNNLSPTAVKQWERARIKEGSLKDWILGEIKQANKFKLVSEQPRVAGVDAQFDAIRDVTLARLIEGVLRRAVKQAKARDEGGRDGAMEQ